VGDAAYVHLEIEALHRRAREMPGQTARGGSAADPPRRVVLSPPEAAKRARAAPAMKGALFGAATSLGAMELRMAALGFGWADVTATQVYTIFDIHPLLADEIGPRRRGASRSFRPGSPMRLAFVSAADRGMGACQEACRELRWAPRLPRGLPRVAVACRGD
jgi:hypothetical protein